MASPISDPRVERAVADSLAMMRAEISAIDREIAMVQDLMRKLAAADRDRATARRDYAVAIAALRAERTGNPPADPAGEKPQA